MTLITVGLIYSSYALLTCQCAQEMMGGEFVKSTDSWLSLISNKLGVFLPKELPFLFVMRNQNLIVVLYALTMLTVIGAAILRLPGSKFALKYWLVVSAMFLNIRFDADSGMIVKIDPWKLQNLIMTVGVLAGVHYMEDQEAEVKRIAGEKERQKLTAQTKISKSTKKDEIP